MRNYNYMEAMKADIKAYLEDSDWKMNIDIDTDMDDKKNEWYDDMFISDSITGNASGSYTFNRYEAQENIFDNLDLLSEACEDFGCVEELGRKFIDQDFEWMDVTIRCYLLSQALEEVIEEYDMEEALEEIKASIEEDAD